MIRDDYIDPARPSLIGTLRYMGQVCRAIWQDHRDHVRMLRRAERAHPLVQPGWRGDALHIAVVCTVTVLAVVLWLAMAGAWYLLLDWLAGVWSLP